MIVTAGPLTLCTKTELVIDTRFVIVPERALPPAAYVPFVTMISSPGAAASIASWIVAAAVDHEVYGDPGVALLASTYRIAANPFVAERSARPAMKRPTLSFMIRL